jgi:hypothetical protein
VPGTEPRRLCQGDCLSAQDSVALLVEGSGSNFLGGGHGWGRDLWTGDG